MANNMCLAIPGKVLEVDGDEAIVDFGGVRRRANVSFVDAKPGVYVIVHAGFAIQIMDEREAKESLDIWRQVLDGGFKDA
jgi:hydrogenase expression/formation protein HypC